MNWQDIRGNWPVIKRSVGLKWTRLTESEIESIRGDRDYLVRLLEEKYGLDKEAAEAAVDDWRRSLAS